MTDKETEVFNQLIEIIKFYQTDVRERKKQDYKNLQARVWIVNGKLKELQDGLEVPTFFYSEKVHPRFKVKGTPSMIYQDGDKMIFNYSKIER